MDECKPLSTGTTMKLKYVNNKSLVVEGPTAGAYTRPDVHFSAQPKPFGSVDRFMSSMKRVVTHRRY